MIFLAVVVVLAAMLGWGIVYAAELGEAHRVEEQTGQECDVTTVRLWPVTICDGG